LRCLVVHAHPLPESLTRHFCRAVVDNLAAAGNEVDLLDLYQAGFDPRLSQAERASHYAETHDVSAVQDHVALLRQAEVLVLVFPTWWFGMPAILKGWIDRVFAPGVAFDHGDDFGPIKPLLHQLRKVVVVTTLGSPWWVDWFVMRRPVRRVLKTGVAGACAPKAAFHYLPFYSAEKPTPGRLSQFLERLRKACSATV
jgi:putative NADPH-quinone reductase